MNDCPPLLDPKLPQTRRGAERRAALLDAANRLFLERGFDQVSLDDLVAEIGGSKAAIYQYFGNKQGLLVALAEFRCQRFADEYELPTTLGGRSIGEVLFIIARNLYQAFTRPDNIAFMRLIIQESQRDPHIAELAYNAGPRRGLNNTANLLQEATALGQIECPQPFESAVLFLGILRHAQWRLLVGLAPLEPELNSDSFLRYLVERFLAAHTIGLIPPSLPTLATTSS